MKQVKRLTRWIIFTTGFLLTVNIAVAQKTSADSALLERVTALEQQVADQKPGVDQLSSLRCTYSSPHL